MTRRDTAVTSFTLRWAVISTCGSRVCSGMGWQLLLQLLSRSRPGEPLNATVVSPAWLSLKIGPLLRGASSNAFTGACLGHFREKFTVSESYLRFSRVIANVPPSKLVDRRNRRSSRVR